jgi:chaperonin GroES
MTTVKNKVVVRPIADDSQSAGGIFVPMAFIGRSAKAEIVAVGPGTVNKPMKLPAGVLCLHVLGAGEEIEDNGEKFFVMNDADVLAYYEK